MGDNIPAIQSGARETREYVLDFKDLTLDVHDILHAVWSGCLQSPSGLFAHEVRYLAHGERDGGPISLDDIVLALRAYDHKECGIRRSRLTQALRAEVAQAGIEVIVTVTALDSAAPHVRAWVDSDLTALFKVNASAASPPTLSHLQTPLSNERARATRQIEHVCRPGVTKPRTVADEYRRLALEWYTEHKPSYVFALSTRWRERQGGQPRPGFSWIERFSREAYRQWHAMLQSNAHIKHVIQSSSGRDEAPILAGLDFLGLAQNPFDAPRGEESQFLLLDPTMNDPNIHEWIRTLEAGQSDILAMARGMGKTTAALLRLYNCLEQHTLFPVYISVQARSQRQGHYVRLVAEQLQGSLLSYFAVTPAEFNDQAPAVQRDIVQVLRQGFATFDELQSALCERGLSKALGGEVMLEQCERLYELPADSHLTSAEQAALLGRALPYGYSELLILLDMEPGEAPSPSMDHGLVVFANRLDGAGIRVNAFVLSEFAPAFREAGWRVKEITRADVDLGKVLETRVLSVSDRSLDVWCDPDAQMENPDDRLVKAAKTPQDVVRLGNALLDRIGRQQRLLTVEDLDELLPHNRGERAKVTRQRLHEIMKSRYNTAELRALCLDLQVNYEDLGGGTLDEKVIELIEYMQRHDCFDALVAQVQHERPRADW